MSPRTGLLAGLLVSLIAFKAHAQAETLYIAAAPHRDRVAAQKMFGPIASYLTETTGQRFEFAYVADFLEYQARMRKGEFDLVWDGPHFAGWRMESLAHQALVRAPQQNVLVIVERVESNSAITKLAGHRVCAHEPPNFATLLLQSLFTNPSRQPIIVPINGWKAAYDGVITGRCEAAILPRASLDKFDRARLHVRVIYEAHPFPNLTFTAGARIDAGLRELIVSKLLSPDGFAATAALRDEYAGGKNLIRAGNASEYVEPARLLRANYGFWFQP